MDLVYLVSVSSRWASPVTAPCPCFQGSGSRNRETHYSQSFGLRLRPRHVNQSATRVKAEAGSWGSEGPWLEWSGRREYLTEGPIRSSVTIGPRSAYLVINRATKDLRVLLWKVLGGRCMSGRRGGGLPYNQFPFWYVCSGDASTSWCLVHNRFLLSQPTLSRREVKQLPKGSRTLS